MEKEKRLRQVKEVHHAFTISWHGWRVKENFAERAKGNCCGLTRISKSAKNKCWKKKQNNKDWRRQFTSSVVLTQPTVRKKGKMPQSFFFSFFSPTCNSVATDPRPMTTWDVFFWRPNVLDCLNRVTKKKKPLLHLSTDFELARAWTNTQWNHSKTITETGLPPPSFLLPMAT